MKLNSGIDVVVNTSAFDDIKDENEVEAEIIEYFPGTDYQLSPREVAIRVKNNFQWKHANCYVVNKDFVKKVES